MAKVRRFIYVASPRGTKVHIKFGNTSEGPTKCGLHAAKGWTWTWTQPMRDPKFPKSLCKRCQK